MSELPKTMWFGMVRGEWPVHSFTNESHATHWLEQDDGNRGRRVWRADLTNVVQMELVPPVPAALREVVNGSVASPTVVTHHPI